MSTSVIVGVVWVSLVLVAGLVGTLRVGRPSRQGETTRVGRRLSAAADAGVRELGRPVAAAVVLAAGVAVTVGSCWMLGRLAGWLQGSVDVPVFRWFEHRQAGGWWLRLNSLLTQMGNGTETQLLAVVGAIVFAVGCRKRRWWAPFLILPVGYLCERFGAQLLREVVHRGHPPTTLGTWPSGGCARLILILGLAIFLYVRWRRPSRRVVVGLWSVLAVLASIEAYTRVYLLKHWLTDAIGGLIYGTMLLLTLILTFSVLDRDSELTASSELAGTGTPDDARRAAPAAVSR